MRNNIFIRALTNFTYFYFIIYINKYFSCRSCGEEEEEGNNEEEGSTGNGEDEGGASIHVKCLY